VNSRVYFCRRISELRDFGVVWGLDKILKIAPIVVQIEGWTGFGMDWLLGWTGFWVAQRFSAAIQGG